MRRTIPWMLVAISVLPRASFGLNSDTGDERQLLKTKVSIELKNADISDVLRYIAVVYHIPCGMEFAPDALSSDRRVISIHAVNQSLETVLNDITKQDTRYRWMIMDRTIDVAPISENSSILDISIPAIQIRNASEDQTTREILALMPVKIALAQRGLGIGDFKLWQPTNKAEPRRISVESQPSTLRHLLNLVAQQTLFWGAAKFGSEYWINFGNINS